MKLVIISDTHEKESQVILPEGDVLIHCGDFTFQGVSDKVKAFANWMQAQNFQHKICIAGNHELSFQSPYKDKVIKYLTDAGITYLQESSIEIDGIKFYGASWTPFFYNWAFNLPRGEELAKKWRNIPDDTNVLITHGPPYGILDLVQNPEGRDPHQGCEELIKRVTKLPDLKLHCFGHLHHEGGNMVQLGEVIFVNAAICTDGYLPTNPPQIVEI